MSKPKLLNIFLISAILSLALILRLHNISYRTTFGGDQGYDLAAIRNIVVNKDITLLGPKIGPYNSDSNLYLGPAYYYLLLPSLVIANFDPVGPAVFTALLSVLTIFLIYKICVSYLNRTIALLAALLYAINPFLVTQSQSSSNPHLTPFFSALALLSVLKMRASKNIVWPIFAGVCSGIAFQLHYLGISLIILCAVSIVKNKRNFAILLISYFTVLLPQIVFELRHNFFVFHLFLNQFFFHKSTASSEQFFVHLSQGYSNISKLFFGNAFNTGLLLVLIMVLNIKFINSNKKYRSIVLLMFALIILSIIPSALFSGPLMPHYLSASYPAIVIVFGISCWQLFTLNRNPVYKAIIVIFISLVFFINIKELDLASKQGYTMPQGLNLIGIRKAAQIITSDIDSSKKFNIASVLDGDTRAMPYRYLVDVYGKKAQAVENYEKIDSLYLIVKDGNSKVLQYTVWEVSAFKPFEIVKSWHIQNGIRLLKLIKDKKNG